MAYYNNPGYNNSNQNVVFNQPMYIPQAGGAPPPPGPRKKH